MKKLILTAIRDYMKTIDANTTFNVPAYQTELSVNEVLDELNAELNRGAEVKAAKNAEYDAARAVVMARLAELEAPVQLSELFAAVKDELPQGFTKGKLQYGITQLWGDVIERTDDTPRGYRLR